MTTIHLAQTAPVNPPGATPVLSQAQVFKGFQRKIRRPDEFVPVIARADVLSDADGVVTRKVSFKPEAAVSGQPTEAVEVCTELPPSRVDYALDNGSSVFNIISAGPTGAPEDLFVTYVFAWKHPELEAGSAAYHEAEASYKKTAKHAVESSIATTRKLVQQGEI